jgi:hypothetical protein
MGGDLPGLPPFSYLSSTKVAVGIAVGDYCCPNGNGRDSPVGPRRREADLRDGLVNKTPQPEPGSPLLGDEALQLPSCSALTGRSDWRTVLLKAALPGYAQRTTS